MTLSHILAAQVAPSSAGSNPLTIAAYVAGALLSAPALVLIVKMVFFIATTSGKIDTLVVDVATLKRISEDQAGEAQATEMSLLIIENDINVLQEKAGLPLRPFPDRRTGPPDRRHLQ